MQRKGKISLFPDESGQAVRNNRTEVKSGAFDVLQALRTFACELCFEIECDDKVCEVFAIDVHCAVLDSFGEFAISDYEFSFDLVSGRFEVNYFFVVFFFYICGKQAFAMQINRC